MSDHRSLDYQIASLRDAMSTARNDEIAQGVAASIRSLEWLASGQASLKTLIKLRKERPDLFAAIEAVLEAFPDAIISDVRGGDDGTAD